MTKGICPVYHEAVSLGRLSFAQAGNITVSVKGQKNPTFLCTEHPAKEGCKTTAVIHAESGAVEKTICDGSFRPHKDFVH
ncbi:MAG: hypothetical protein A2942_02125 [Candidatus Lloydbacteria bacterium RIFCSPLOWO2_01_FULL_50_20]|uniref:Uncharacterized protein n=1 Tax=Candidatus Lloydbacteria bacterium RIFCSPLOWO2_01_FULL_50_20 TaxID=1798665 RepID=A0A1G2DLQ8_9BACT|nr:MAG: hypothetical protein A3C13_04690 [Candidatus Lloydbacteria bacterium RIFCSPHIGHO2_02_FULL_50_11]OGZ13748.1 MAG: hypothetical protein A2942_02125 [Candidatus Lloydbacteria bacterium RIFCSPLOWO2_01_FULL_50_20]